MVFAPENHKNQQSTHENNNKLSFSDFSRVAEAFVSELTEASFWRFVHARKQKYADLL